MGKGVYNNDKLYFNNQLLPILDDYKPPKPRRKGQKKKGKKTKRQLLKDRYGDDIIVKLLLLLLGKEKGNKGDKESKKKAKLDTGFKGMRRAKGGGGGNFASASQVRGQRAEAEKKAKEDKAKAAIAVAAIPLPGEDAEDTAARVTAVKIASTDDPVQKVLYELTGGMTLPKIQGLHGGIAYLGQFVEPLLTQTLTAAQRETLEQDVVRAVVGFRGGDFEKKFKPDFSKGKDTEIKRGAREGDLRVREVLQRDITGAFGLGGVSVSAPPPVVTATTTAPPPYGQPPTYGQPPQVEPEPQVAQPKLKRGKKLDTTPSAPPQGGGILGMFGSGASAIASSLSSTPSVVIEEPQAQTQPDYFNKPLLNIPVGDTLAQALNAQLTQQAFEEEAQLTEALQQSQSIQSQQPYIARRIPQSSASTTNTISEDEREAISNRRVFGRRRRTALGDPSLQEVSKPYVDAVYQDVLDKRGLEQIQQEVVTPPPPKKQSKGEQKKSKDEQNIDTALNIVATYDWDELPIGQAVTAKGKASRTKPITDLDAERQQLEELIRGADKKAPSRLLQIVENSMSKLQLGQSLIKETAVTKKALKIGTTKGMFDKTNDGIQIRETGKEEKISDYFPAYADLLTKQDKHHANTDEGRIVRDKLQSIRDDFYWGIRDKLRGDPQSKEGYTDDRSVVTIEDAEDAYGYDLPADLEEYGNDIRIRSGERIIGSGPKGISIMTPSGLVRYISALGKPKESVSASKYTTSKALLQKLEGKRGLTTIEEAQVERARKNVDDYEKVQPSKAPQVEGLYEVSTTDPSDIDEPKSASAYRNNKKIIKAVNRKRQKGESLTKNESDRYALAVKFNTEFKTARDANAEAQAEISAISGGAGQEAAGSSTEGFYTQSSGSEYGVPYSDLAEHAQRRFGDDTQGQIDYKMDKYSSYVAGAKIKSKGRRREEQRQEKLQLQKEGQEELLQAQSSGERFIDQGAILGGGDFTKRQQEPAYVTRGTAVGRGDSGHNIIMREIAEETDQAKQSKLRNTYGEVLKKYAKDKILREAVAEGQSTFSAQQSANQLDFLDKKEIVADADNLVGSVNLQVGTEIFKRINKDWKKLKGKGGVQVGSVLPPVGKKIVSEPKPKPPVEAKPPPFNIDERVEELVEDEKVDEMRRRSQVAVRQTGVSPLGGTGGMLEMEGLWDKLGKRPLVEGETPQEYEQSSLNQRLNYYQVFLDSGLRIKDLTSAQKKQRKLDIAEEKRRNTPEYLSKKFQDEEGRWLERATELRMGLEQESDLTEADLEKQQKAEQLQVLQSGRKKIEPITKRRSGSSSGSSSSSRFSSIRSDSESESSSSEDLPQPPPKKGKSLDWWEKKARQHIVDSFEDSMKSSEGVVMKPKHNRDYFMGLKSDGGREDIKKIRGIGSGLPGWSNQDLRDELLTKGVDFSAYGILGVPKGVIPADVTNDEQQVPIRHKYKLDKIKETDWYRDNILNAPIPDFSDYVAEGQAQDAERLQEFQQGQASRTSTQAKGTAQVEDLVYKKGRERKKETGFALPPTGTGTQPVFKDESLEVGEGGLNLLGQTLEIAGGTIEDVLGKGGFNMVESEEEDF